MRYQENIEEEGNKLLNKYLKGECSPEEALKAIQMLKKPSSEAILFEALSNIWDQDRETDIQSEKADSLSSTLDKIHHDIDSSREYVTSQLHKRIRLNKIFIRAAAILFLPFLAISFLYLREKIDFTAKDVAYVEVSVPNGSKVRTVLPDGTEVWLNSGSTLKYPKVFPKKSRTAILNGEAFFNVFHDPTHPFVVETGDLDIVVTGTCFNVMAYEDEDYISTTLEEGKVAIEWPDARGRTYKPYSMEPNERIVYHKEEGTLEKSMVSTDQFTSWKDGRLIFRNNSLEYIFHRLERWYNTEIEISGDAGFLHLPYTMTIEDETIEQVLNYLTIASGIAYELAPRHKVGNGEIAKTKYIIRNI